MKCRLSAVLIAALCLLSACTSGPEASTSPADLPTAPPELTVTVGEETCTALRGGWSWTYDLGNGTYSGTIADSSHPLDCQELTPQLTATEGQAVLSFSLEPDTITAHCWPESAWGNTEAQSEEVEVEDGVLTLKPGGCLYEVRTAWDAMPDYEGDCSYLFFVRCTPA